MAGDPYTDVTVLNYNSNPPADDGTEVPSNEVTWDKHKAKLGDPLKTAIESVNTNLGSAVDKLSGGITSVSNDYTVLAGDQGKTIVMTAAAKTITTLAAATAGSPFRFWISNTSSGDCTLDGNAAETIDGALTVTIPSGRGLMVETDGSNWKTGGQNWPEIVVRPAPMFEPRGRLTISSGVPVLSSDVTAQTTDFWTPRGGNSIMLFDGLFWRAYTFAELSQALSDATKSPSATGASKVYDKFVWVDGSTVRSTRGPSWDTGTGGSNTVRGTGAGSTELITVAGVPMNKYDISNGPAAQRGVFVGTIATDGSNQLNMKMNPAAAAGGGACRIDVWNAYNRVPVFAASKDSTDSWTYGTTTWRSANNNNNNRVTAVFGLNEDEVSVAYNAFGTWDNDSALIGVGLDVTNAYTGSPGYIGSAYVNGTTLVTTNGSVVGSYGGQPGLGQHFFQATEYGVSGTTTFYGDNGAPLNYQMALTFRGRM